MFWLIKKKIVAKASKINLLNKEQKKLTFLLYSFPFTYILLLTFAFNNATPDSVFSFFYVFTIPTLYFITLSLVTYLLSKLIWTKAFLWLLVVPKILLDIFLLADFFVFNVYRFHIDLLFIKMLIYDFSGIGISIGLTLFSLVIVSIIVAINLMIFKNHSKWPKLKFWKWQTSIICLCLVGQMLHVVGFEYKDKSYTQYTPFLPYYPPLTSSFLMIQLKKIAPETFPQKSEASTEYVENLLKNKKVEGTLNYPMAEMQCNVSAEQKHNVLMFVIESWRFDAMNAEVSPNIYKFSQQSSVYNNHFSSGSVTVNGLFGLMHGLHPSYRDYVNASPYTNQSLLTKTLASQNYEISAYTSSWLDRFSLKAMMFGKIADERYINYRQNSSYINDINVVNVLLSNLNSPQHKPWFKFTFLTSSHHPYRYPEEHAVFKPISKDPEAFIFNKYIDHIPFINDSKNSVRYIDELFGQILEALSTTQQFDNTMIIVTSDHGEEFNDNQQGYWGHGSNFTKYQVKVPMIIKMPKQKVARNITKRTAHIDIAPTILTNIAGCTNPVEQYSNGINIFPEEYIKPTRPLIISSYKNKAYLIDDKIYETMLGIDSYNVNDLSQENSEYNYIEIQKLKQQETIFMR
ncbi:sulfatase-like hydrolase/transferase [Thalassomonas sp. M1454]|nr:sulfatase-like hydrolase/transferase [Thalassomonas sp. M1454]